MYAIYKVNITAYNVHKSKKESVEFIIFGRTLRGAKKNALKLFFANMLAEDVDNRFIDIELKLRRV